MSAAERLKQWDWSPVNDGLAVIELSFVAVNDNERVGAQSENSRQEIFEFPSGVRREQQPLTERTHSGKTSFATTNASRLPFTGKEKDEETGLYYHGARYYAPWLGRWTAADPAGVSGGLNLFEYGASNPIRFNDPNGQAPVDASGALNDADPNVKRLRAQGVSDVRILGEIYKGKPKKKRSAAGGGQQSEGGSTAKPGGGTAGAGESGGGSKAPLEPNDPLNGDLDLPSDPGSDGSGGESGTKGGVKRSKYRGLAETATEASFSEAEEGGSEFGVGGGSADKGALLDSETGQAIASSAIIADAIASVVSVGKLAVKGLAKAAGFIFKKGIKPLGEAIGKGLKAVGGFFKKLFGKKAPRGTAALDANALIRGLEGGELAAVDAALAGRVPVISITAAKEFLKKGDVEVLRSFLKERGGRLGAAATSEQITNLQAQARVLGRVLRTKDAAVAGSAIREGSPLITRDRKLGNFLRATGTKVEGF